ncbi:DUF4189 domain-containing protein [Dyella marensis]|uniref:DUF4189 domain-containing protein n=1 Tax=Dyella TaxID=231454 RepID=UPI0015A4F3F8|nr:MULTISPECIES: DUF4189 domain-containing protein [Dyella]
MKLLLTLLLCLLSFSAVLHAEQGCPPGMIPEGGQGVSSCRPIPGYNQGGAAQPAPSVTWVSRWGAVAVDAQVTRFSGASRDKASKKEAEQIAMKNCLDQGATQCQIIASYANGCVALAANDTVFGAASRNTIPESEQAALAQCGDAACKVIYTQCSQPKLVR